MKMFDELPRLQCSFDSSFPQNKIVAIEDVAFGKRWKVR